MQSKATVVDQKYTQLCTQLGNLISKRSDVEAQIKAVESAISGLNSVAQEMRQLEADMGLKLQAAQIAAKNAEKTGTEA